MKRWKKYLSVMTAAALVISGPVVPAATTMAADGETTETRYELPTDASTLKVEAEDFELITNGDSNSYVRIVEKDWASGGKIVDWFEKGNSISMKFHAAEAGDYTVTATYRSGRTEDSNMGPNEFAWSGTNVESGSKDVYGESQATTTHTVEFTIKVTAAGDGVLTFTAGDKAGPQVDKFEFKKAVKETETETETEKETEGTTTPDDTEAPASWGATPNEEQLWYMKQGLAAFCHFGPNTFNNVEWGENYGTKSPAEIFTLTEKFDAENFVKTLKEAGFSRLIITAKHHDGFCLWASDLTTYDIASTNYDGDILEEISDACTKYNMDMGCYLSPWDIYEDKYGCFGNNKTTKNDNGKGEYTDYNELYVAWINEICTAKKADGSFKYGNNNPNRRSDRFVEWWMDGAQGNNSNRQSYDWKAILGAIKTNNPHCQVFGTGKAINGKNGEEDKKLAGTGGIHWIGNENGWASNETWAKIRIGEDYETLPKSDGAYIGVYDGVQWSVPEVDTKILSGWFWTDDAGDETTKTEKELADIYFRTVGRGATLLLNFSPNKQGKVSETQLNRAKEFGENIKETFATDLTKIQGVTATADSEWSDKYGASNVIDAIPDGKTYDETYWAPADGKTTGTLTIDLGGVKKFDVVSIEEYIQKGQTIAAFTVEYKDVAGNWHDFFTNGKTISAKRLCRADAVQGTAIRINITDAKATPKISNVGVYKASKGFATSAEDSIDMPTNLKKVSIGDAERSGNWNFEADEDGNANGSAWTNEANASATFTFTGTKAWVVGTADPNHGKMDVYIDGVKVDTANTYKSSRKMGAVLYVTSDLEYGEHTIKLVRSTSAVGLSKIYYTEGAGIFSVKQSECELMYGGTTEIEIVREAGSKGEATVSYSTLSAGAEQGVNYTHLAGKVTFAEGETSKKITLTGLENEDREIDGKDFYFALLSSEEASIGANNTTHVVLYRADAKAVQERIEALDLSDYSEESVAKLNTAMETLKALPESATKEEVKAAVKAVLEAKNALETKEEESVYTLPTGDAELTIEAEDFTLVTNGGNDYIRIAEKEWASGGKIVDWFEDGNAMYVKFHADEAGEYTVKADYRSGRAEGGTQGPNAFVWEGTNVESGEKEVYGEANATTTHTAEFTIKVTAAGDGILKFTATNPKCGPQIDKFVIKQKENIYTLPTGAEELTVEAEEFKMYPNGDASKHVHVESKDWASGGKIVNWFEDGDKISMKFNAPEAGEYSVTATYRSGRTEGGTGNEFTWTGTNIENGTIDVFGESGATTTHTVTFTIKVTKAGEGELSFTANSPKCGPMVDKFVFKKKVAEPEPEVVAVTGVTLNKTTATLTKAGETVQLTATVAPANATNKKVSFKSSDEKVAKVDANGKVTAVANGTATITVTTEDGNKTATCAVTVNIPAEIVPDKVPETLVNDVKAALSEADAKVEGEYTEESWKAFVEAREAAKKVAADKNATKADYEKALADLQAAAKALQKKALAPVPSNPTTPPTTTGNVLPAGTQQKLGKGIYKVLKADAKNGTVALVRPVSATNKTYKVPASVKLNGIRYKVTEISKNAFKNNKKLTRVTIGKNVTKIGANAFSGAKSLKTIKITSKSLKNVGKNAFKGINKKATVKVPKSKKTAYTKILKKGKIAASKVK